MLQTTVDHKAYNAQCKNSLGVLLFFLFFFVPSFRILGLGSHWAQTHRRFSSVRLLTNVEVHTGRKALCATPRSSLHGAIVSASGLFCAPSASNLRNKNKKIQLPLKN